VCRPLVPERTEKNSNVAAAAQLWRAVRVISGIGGAQRSAGLEAPFVGRDRELRQIKDLFHASAEERRGDDALVTVYRAVIIGPAR